MSQPRKGKRGPRTGRPTSEESRQLDEKVIEEALALFLEQGYDGTSMEAVASAAGISKRTLYARYSDKSALFLDALRWSMKDWIFSLPEAIEIENRSLESALLMTAEALLQQALNPTYVKLGRIAAAKADLFHSQTPYNYNMSLSPRVQAIVNILKAHRDELDENCQQDLEMTAELFVSLISGIPARLASFGTVRAVSYEQERMRLAVRLFVKGISKFPRGLGTERDTGM